MTQLRPVLSTLRRYAVPAPALVGLAAGLTAQYLLKVPEAARLILLVTLLAGGLPVVAGTVWGMLRRKFAADIVATLAIVGAAVTGEYLAGCVIVRMQTGGEALEAYAVRRASAALEALLARAPHMAHRHAGEVIEGVPVEEVAVGDLLLVRPGELISRRRHCPGRNGCRGRLRAHGRTGPGADRGRR
jgi:cation transport ATPase